MPIWASVSLLFLSLLCLWLFLRLAISLRKENPDGIPTSSYTTPDFLFGGSLVAFFLLTIWTASGSAPPPVTLQALFTGASFYLALVTLIAGFLIFRNINPAEMFGLSPPHLTKKITTGFLWLAIAYPPILLAQLASYNLFPGDPQPQEVVKFLLQNPTWQSRSAVIGLALFAAPLAEETIFRGYLYGILRKLGGRFAALSISSLLFAAIHLHLPSFAGLFLLGLSLALLYEKTRSLWVPFAMHALFNGISVCLAIFWPDLMQ